MTRKEKKERKKKEAADLFKKNGNETKETK